MPLHPAEEAVICAFVLPDKQERLLRGLARKRKQTLDELNHFRHWDPRFIRAPGHSDLAATLKAAGMPDPCHVISDDASRDGREIPLDDALESASFLSFATLLCDLQGRVACYFDEEAAPRRVLILQRPA
jgi:hypothetical protein